MKKLKTRLKSLDKRFVIIGLFILVGLALLVAVKAATPTAHFEAESGTRTANASVASDATASGGQYLKFNTPTSSGSCALPNYPDASCTGVPAGTTLTAYTGPQTITTPNTVIDSKNVNTCLVIRAPGVIIRKSKVIATCGYVIDAYGYTGERLLVEDSEISCNESTGTAIGEEYVTTRRLLIHGCENGYDINFEFTIEDNYIHDLYSSGSEAHEDGIQMPIGRNVSIVHNTITVFGTSAIITPGVQSAIISNVLIQDNLLAGGAATLYCPTGGAGDNVRVINNHFSRMYYPTVGAYFPWTECEDEAVVTGNVYHETGLPVPL